MRKKRKIDYIINGNDNMRLIFRFYPRQSTCHSFGDEPPKNWNDVYKVYYSYAIINQWKIGTNEHWISEVVFSDNFDECSVIDEVAFACEELTKGCESFTRKDGEKISWLDRKMTPLGDGTEWMISKRVYTDVDDKKYISYIFTLFNGLNKGYRFKIEEAHLKEFGEYLNECCEYMLAHGNPI